MHLLTVIWQLKTDMERQHHLSLQWLQKTRILRGDIPCWMLFNSSILSSNTVILYMTVTDQRVVPTCEVHVGCPLDSAPVYWTRISDADIDIYFLPTIPSKHSNVFMWQISQRSGCISCTRTMNFPQCRLQHSTSQLIQSSNEGFLS